MSVSPPPVPLPNPDAGSNPIEPLWQQALGSPANGLRAQHIAYALGTALPVLSSYRSGYVVSAIPGSPFPAPSAAIAVNPTGPTTVTHTDTWTENNINYSAVEVDTSELTVNATTPDNNGDWSYSEQLVSSFTITTTNLADNSAALAGGDYNYTFSASGDSSHSSFTYSCTLADATAGGVLAGPLYLDNALPMTDCWTETHHFTRTITNQTYMSGSGGTGSGSDCGSGWMTGSYWSYSGSYTDPSDDTLTGTGSEGGSRASSSSYSLNYSASYSGSSCSASVSSGWAYGSQSESDSAGYSASGGYTPTGPFTDPATSVSGTGTQGDYGGYAEGGSYSASFSPASGSGGASWNKSWASGTSYESGWDDSSYSESGSYSTSGSDGTINGTFSDSGSDNTGYGYNTGWGCSSGNWFAASGSGSESDSGGSNDSYSGSGTYADSGSGWSASGAQSESVGDSDSYGYTTGYSLASGGTWQETGCSGGSQGSGYTHSSYSGSGSYSASWTDCRPVTVGPPPHAWAGPSLQAPNGTPISGTFQESGSDNTSYNYNTTASGSGETGTRSESESGGSNDSYSGSGTYAASGTGWNASGTARESGSDSDSYGYTTNYTLASDGTWQVSSGSGGENGSGTAFTGYSASGSYSASWTDSTPVAASPPPQDWSAPCFAPPNGTAISGSFHQSASDNSSYGYSTQAHCDASGNWTETGSGNQHDYGGGSGSYSGGYSGALTFPSGGANSSGSGTVNESGSASDSYGYTTNYSLASDGTWQVASGSSGSNGESGSGSAFTGYSASGPYTWGDYSGSYSSSGSDNSSYGYSSHAQCDSSGNWTSSGSGSQSDSGSSHYSYSGSGNYSAGGDSQVQEVSGTLAQSGGGGFSYHDGAGWSLGSSGNWQRTSAGGSASGSDNAYCSYSGSGSYSRSDGATYALSGSVQASGYQSGSDNYQTALGMDADGNWVNISGSGSSTQASGNGCSYSGAGSFSVSGNPWFHSTASEHGSQYTGQGETDYWTIAGGSSGCPATAGDWAQSGSAQGWTENDSESHYDYSVASGSGGSTSTNSSGSTTCNYNEEVTQDTWRHSGSTYNGNGTTSWSSSSGSGTADFYETDGFTPASGNSGSSPWNSVLKTHDTWSKPSFTGQNQVYGEKWYAYVSGSGSASLPSSPTATYGPVSQADAGFSSTTFYEESPHAYNLRDLGSPPSNEDGHLGPDLPSTWGASLRCNAAGTRGTLLGQRDNSSFILAPPLFAANSQSPIPTFSHDPAGNLTSLTDPAGNTTTWTYGGGLSQFSSDENGTVPFNRVTQETDALGASRCFSYDTAGNLSQYQDRNGAVRQYGYDSSGNVASETWYANATDADASQNAENTIQYTHDSLGRITSESDNSSSDTYTYDSNGNLTSATETVSGGPTVTLAYQYNTAGERTQMAATIDGTADFVDDYTYSSSGEVASVHQHGVPGGDAVADVTVDFTYNDAGELTTVDRYEGGQLAVEGDYSYDSLGRLAGLVYRQGDTVLNSYAWTYSASGSPLLSGEGQGEGASRWSPTGGLMPATDTTGVLDALISGGLAGLDLVTSCTSVDGTADYSYDPTGQLTAATYASPPGTDGTLVAGEGQGEGVQPAESYAWDANGNPAASGDVIGADNELLSDGTYTYSYDAEGNCTQRVAIATGAVTDYAWDARERLVGVTSYASYSAEQAGTPTQVVTYQYDAENRWVGENIETFDTSGDSLTDHETRFAYDGNQIVLEFDSSPIPNPQSPIPALAGADLSHRYL
jgi:YD repeat-containing protein